jgi:glycosyltransferase involved in cell wall biosynthesis
VDGKLAPPLAARGWAQAIEELLASPTNAARLGAAARRTARVTFSLERTIEQTANLYRSLLG